MSGPSRIAFGFGALGVVALATLATPRAAAAQSVMVIVTHAGTPDGAMPLRAAAVEAIAEHGARLIPTPDAEPCEEAECAAAHARRTGADHVLLIAVRSPTEVALEAVPAEGAPLSLTQEVADADFRSAVGALVDRFLAEERRPAVGFLMVDTVPREAEVWIDGAAAGPSPLRRSVSIGSHQIRVVGAGGEARERTVEVVAGTESSVVLDFAQAREPAPEPDEPGPELTRSEPSPFNWLLGAGLALGGVLALISPLQTLAQDGQCVDMIENVGCVERVHIGAQTGVLLGIGIAALIAAVIVDAVAPIRVDVAVSERGAGVALEGRF